MRRNVASNGEKSNPVNGVNAPQRENPFSRTTTIDWDNPGGDTNNGGTPPAPRLRSDKPATQTERLRRASVILAAHKHGELLVGDDLEFMRSVFAGDPRYCGADKPDIQAIKVAHAPKPYSMHRCFWVRSGGAWTAWSFQKALRKPQNEEAAQ